jgi:anti-sigma regulatory factor (Ser/Thr protein kinase)
MLVQETSKKIFTNNYSTSLESRVRILDEVRNAVRRGRVIPRISGEELTLIVDEAVTNAMEHGNRWDGSKTVSVTVFADETTLHIVIEDQGDGFDFRNHKSEFAKGNLLSQRGRGISLIRRFCSPSWNNSGRLVDLRIPLFN